MEKNKKDDNNDKNIFHSSGYADVASKGAFGSTSNISFSQRQTTDFNRKIIAGYNRSSLGSAYGALRAKAVSGDDRISRPNVPYIKKLGASTNNQPAQTPRKYNPFA